ncbi:MAG: Maf family protein [Terriglobia bacterium]
MTLILASRSPRRRELLGKAGIPFEVRPVTVDESLRRGEAAVNYVERVARDKALTVAQAAAPGSPVLGADTVVVAAGEVLGKPRDAADAARMLRLLSGGTHYVVTGVCLVRAPDTVEALLHEATTVVMKPLSEAMIQEYIRSGEPLDKAGAYAIQGLASKFIARVDGNVDNVVGLPVARVAKMLSALESGGGAGEGA